MNNTYEYAGKELELFSHAVNWKKYFSSRLMPFIHGKVLEVGSGIGDTSRYLNNAAVSSWVCLEPDETLYLTLKKRAETAHSNYSFIHGDLAGIPEREKFNTIIYIDVLEHIKEDQKQVNIAALHLEPGGSIIILSPAYNFLMNQFDKEIGHYRRYSKSSLRKLAGESGLKEKKMFYLESAGIFLLLLNKFLFKKKYPSKKNILFWDRYLIPLSKITDKVFNYSFGKTIIAVFERKN